MLSTQLIRGLVGLHASFTVSDETIREAGDLARELGTVLHVHVAEGPDDVEDAVARGFDGPLERLIELAALEPGSLLIHGVHLSLQQIEKASEIGCWFVHNPRSNEGNGVGYAGALAHASRVALGTDGWNADMAEEQEALFRLAAAHGDDKAGNRLAAGRDLIAERFGFPATGLAAGAAGDIVVRENGRVVHVVVNGRVVVLNGKLITADLETINAEARIQAARLWQRMAGLDTAES